MGNNSSSSHNVDMYDRVDGSTTADLRSQTAVAATSDPIYELCQILITKSEKHDVGHNISAQTFQRYFSSEQPTNVNVLLYNIVCHPKYSDVTPFITSETFIRFCRRMRNQLTETHLERTYLLMFSKCKATIDRIAVEDFFRTCFLLEAEMVGSKYACNRDSLFLASVVDSIATACVLGEKSTSIENLHRFLQINFPHLIHSSLHRWILRKISTVQPLPSNVIQRHYNGMMPKSSSRNVCSIVKSHHSEEDESQLHPVIVWFFSNTLPSIYTQKKPKALPVRKSSGQFQINPHDIVSSLMKYECGLDWELLYSTSIHGHSMNRLQHHVFAYRGPTAMLIKTDGDMLFCVAIDHEWRERVPRWGGNQCCVLQVTPVFKSFESGEKLMYFNLTTRGYPKGLHVGKNPKSPILEIDPDMSIAKVEQIPYKLELLEIWGCSGNDAKEEQVKQKKWEQCQAEKHKKININAVDWNENPDRYILELAGRPTYGANFKR